MKRITVENVFIVSSILVDSQNKQTKKTKTKSTTKQSNLLNVINCSGNSRSHRY